LHDQLGEKMDVDFTNLNWEIRTTIVKAIERLNLMLQNNNIHIAVRSTKERKVFFWPKQRNIERK
jgi:hypothetical protein